MKKSIFLCLMAVIVSNLITLTMVAYAATTPVYIPQAMIMHFLLIAIPAIGLPLIFNGSKQLPAKVYSPSEDPLNKLSGQVSDWHG